MTLSGASPLPIADPAPAAPEAAAAGERLLSLDFTRGIAVMGILAANVIAFGQPFLAYLVPDGFLTPPQPGDSALWAAQFVLVDGKLRGLFTLLFGAGLVLFAERARLRGEGAMQLQLRRLAWLLVFGLMHYFLLWRGDILTLYALAGLIALMCIDWEPHRQVAMGIAAYVTGALMHLAALGFAWAKDIAEQALAPERIDARAETAINLAHSYPAQVAHVLANHRWDWLTTFAQTFLETIPLMLFGMALYRLGLFDGRMDRRAQVRWGWAGVLGGTALSVPLAIWVAEDGPTLAGAMFAFDGPGALVRLPVILGLAALLAAWGPHATGWLGQRVIAAGRMAFSNYIGTSLVMLFVFSGWALGLYGTLTRIELYAVAVAGWIVMLAWSKPWLERFRFGPLEWLWRCLTYGRWFALRRVR